MNPNRRLFCRMAIAFRYDAALRAYVLPATTRTAFEWGQGDVALRARQNAAYAALGFLDDARTPPSTFTDAKARGAWSDQWDVLLLAVEVPRPPHVLLVHEASCRETLDGDLLVPGDPLVSGDPLAPFRETSEPFWNAAFRVDTRAELQAQQACASSLPLGRAVLGTDEGVQWMPNFDLLTEPCSQGGTLHPNRILVRFPAQTVPADALGAGIVPEPAPCIVLPFTVRVWRALGRKVDVADFQFATTEDSNAYRAAVALRSTPGAATVTYTVDRRLVPNVGNEWGVMENAP